mmetsp:Transcript_28461/g.44469  ORF Transcript_28461/g.44469 Transcript_28461/m.44469 type:complete len:201 (-) Transcript_28461:1258-1860(-)
MILVGLLQHLAVLFLILHACQLILHVCDLRYHVFLGVLSGCRGLGGMGQPCNAAVRTSVVQLLPMVFVGFHCGQLTLEFFDLQHPILFVVLSGCRLLDCLRQTGPAAGNLVQQGCSGYIDLLTVMFMGSRFGHLTILYVDLRPSNMLLIHSGISSRVAIHWSCLKACDLSHKGFVGLHQALGLVFLSFHLFHMKLKFFVL